MSPNDSPLRVKIRCVGLKWIEHLLLLEVQPHFTSSRFWLVMVLRSVVGHAEAQT